MSTTKPNYNDQQMNQEYQSRKDLYENTYGQEAYLPTNYHPAHNVYKEDDGSGAASFLYGALVGGVIGAAAALFLAPKSGSEMREDFSQQASQLKDKSIEISAVAKEKASGFTSVAKEKSGELSKTFQEQSGQIVNKVKSLKPKASMPMDDGTASSEGEESMEYVQQKANDSVDTLDENNLTATAEAFKDAVAGDQNQSPSNQSTKNSNVSYDNSDNLGDNKITNQNYVSDVKEEK
ncbi:YtxH domain-containing protein [Sporosarcina sp. HYO08]|uniref:YtxH domain-containing protein n=1 Tax=Sporosarcina sp. HYO08 TaxID=1759557 RepID=UPI000799E565|nr:YtxH domain-containing protein [Sporosarcina sp. HYO08]KXH87160.1 hypothetical protein AU377_00885 [Sporosarcina sp. HYO08]